MMRNPSTNEDAFLNDFLSDIDRMIEVAFAKLYGVVADAEARMQAALARYGVEPPPPPSVN